MPEQVNPLVGKTDNRKAGCGKSASPVWREGKPICLVFPTLSRLAEESAGLQLLCNVAPPAD